MIEPEITYPTVTEEGFPGGVMCPECDRQLKVGDPYNSHLDGMYGEYSVETLTCVYCVPS